MLTVLSPAAIRLALMALRTVSSAPGPSRAPRPSRGGSGSGAGHWHSSAGPGSSSVRRGIRVLDGVPSWAPRLTCMVPWLTVCRANLNVPRGSAALSAQVRRQRLSFQTLQGRRDPSSLHFTWVAVLKVDCAPKGAAPSNPGHVGPGLSWV